MFSVAPNILLAPNMTQNAERKHRTQDANTAHNRPPIEMVILDTISFCDHVWSRADLFNIR